MDAIQINFKSDFDFILELRDGLGMPIGWPEFDWTLTLCSPTSRRRFVVFRRGGMLKGCFNDGGRIHVVADKHGLGPGRLAAEFVADLRNERYPDGVQRVVVPEPLDIVLTDRGGSLPPVQLGNISIVLPAYPAASPSDEPDEPEEPDLQAIAAGCFLSVDRNEGSSRLIAHGARPLLEAGLTPVLFRCLWRSNELTGDGEEYPERCREKRWTRFTRFGDAVAIDADGVLSFRTDLLAIYHNEHAERSTSASALLLREEPAAVVYGRRILDIDDMRALRMLCFPFVLGFIDASDDGPARRWTLADCVATVPFRVRFTPVFHYEKDEVTRAECFVGFELK